MAYVLPLISSLLYVLAVLYFKQAAERGVGVGRSTVWTNLFCGAAFAPLWVLGGTLLEPARWHEPALVALVFLGSQALGFLAIRRGDVSVATPVMGLKVVLVALFVTLLLGERLPPALWAAAGLSSAGIVALNRGAKPGGPVGPAILFGLLAAAGFALFDVLVQKWAPAWGAGRFLPLVMGCVALYSLAYLALFRKRLGPMVPGAGRPLVLGAGLMAIQAVLLIGAIGYYAKATPINVVYSARGLWSVLAVWWVGPWFGNREREAGAAALRGRLLGAALLLSAILLAVLAR